MHKLIIEDDEGRATVVPMVRDELTIGRKEGNTIRLTERNVSRRHARLLKQNGAVIIEDLASYTGVRVNGIRVAVPTPVRDGDQIEIGDYKLMVRSEVAADAAPPTVEMASAAPAQPLAGAHTEPLGLAAAAQDARAAAIPGHHIDAAPTMPLKTLVEQGRSPDGSARAAPPARLVVVTTGLGGMEFRLDRPSLVIGRTEENDIILNHPSISRHHAKVVRDGERYTIVDLQSANGVRVGGESYERVDVQAGDVVELGHVKLRFVGPFESWAYDPREYLGKSRRNLKIGAAVGGVALAGILILMLQGRKAPPPPAPPAVVAAPVPAGPTPDELYTRATAAAEAEDWEKATTSLDLLLNRAASDPAAAPLKARATEMRGKVELERRAAPLFAAFQQAVTAKEPDVALSRFDDIPDDSLYKGRAEPALPDIKTQFLAAHLDLADAARQQGRCDDVLGEVQKVQQIDPENRKARDIARSCRARPAVRVAAAAPAVPRVAERVRPPRAVAPAHAAVSRPAIVTDTTDEFAPKPAEPAAADPAELIRQARDAWLHQQCGSAIELSRRALKLKPGANDAHQIIAACACSMKDKEGAMKSYARLDDRNRAMVRTLCARNGVELE